MENIINRSKPTEKFDEVSVLNVLYNRYGTEYDLTEAKYTSANDTILIKCIKHNKEIKKHFYTLNVDDYIPCEDCRRIKSNNSEMNKMLEELYPTYELIDDILVRSKSSEVKCNKHNSVFKMNFENLNRIYKSKDFSNLPIPCKECKAEAKGKPITEVKENKVVRNVDKYAQVVSNLNCTILKSSNGDADIQCNQCNKTHSVRIESYVLNGYGCPYCNIDKILQESNSNKMRNYRDESSSKFVFSENFKFKVRNKYNNDDSFIIGEYQGMSEKIKCNCNLHGEYEAAPQDIINSEVKSKMCPSCASNKLLTFDDVEKSIESIHGDKYRTINYESGNVTMHCKEHGDFTSDYGNVSQFKTGCPICANSTRVSKAEYEICEFLEEYGLAYIQQDNSINVKMPIDITLPDYKLAIEYNGLIWHSFGIDSMCNNIKEINKNKHLDKTKMLEAEGYQLFHINEDEWNDSIKKEIWKSKIRIKTSSNVNKIYARKCEIKTVDNTIARMFFINNHLQGFTPGGFINYGLFYNNELVSCMIFRRGSRFRKGSNSDTDNSFELLRFASLKNTVVIGGSSKLLKSFIADNSATTIDSYANRRWSSGDLYNTLGFEFKFSTEPALHFIEKFKIVHSRFIMWKENRSKYLTKEYDESKSQIENAILNGLRVMYDSGNLLYSMDCKNISIKNNSKFIKVKEHEKSKTVKYTKPEKVSTSVTDRFVRDRIKHYDAMIELGKTKYGEKISYLPIEESGFQNNRSKVKFICAKHGEFTTVAENFKLDSNKFGCIKCNSEFNAEIKKSSGMNSKESLNKRTDTNRRKGYSNTVEKLSQKFIQNNYTFLDFENSEYESENKPFKMICNGIVNNNKVHESKEIYIRAANAKITTSLHLCEECRKFKK